ncbi:hypothetical protein KIW84_054660 [Lathyrus oleraceus]|uniref:Gag-pol polyprotein n=1 Tax=Pisum sativum TaxID=3888 RepID=A0A9D4WUU5_PEA|nr:hypothetical protein KIW84_054660 [Pisum sativum]
MDETRTLLLADDLRKIATSGMSGNGVENNEQAQGLFASRGRNNERSKGRGGKSRSKSRAHAERTCFKCEDSKFVISRDVTFDEKSMVPNDGDVKILNQVIEIESEDQPDSSRGQVENPIASEDEEEDEHDHEEVQQENTHVLQQQQQESLETTRPKRNYKIVQKFGSDKPLRHYGQVNLVEYALSVEDDEPITFKQAIKDKDRESWLVAMEEEMQTLHKNKTWEVL